MHCSGCGQAWMAGQRFCSRCGWANELGTPTDSGTAPWGWLPLAQIERQVNALAVGWVVYSGMAALFGLVGLAFWNASIGEHMGSLGSLCCRIGHSTAGFSWIGFACVALLLQVGLGFAAGFGLMQKTTWGRWAAIVAGLLNILHLPFGTAMGIWTLVVLLKAPNAAGYEAMAR
jgi:hypothetical protein